MSDTNQKGIIDDDVLRISEKEWNLFQKVQNYGGAADCQSQRNEFMVMRCSQFMAWTPVVRASYERDLDETTAKGRNLLSDKYANMMRYTHPEEYSQLKDSLPPYTKEKQKLVAQIVRIVLRWAEEMWIKYPCLMMISRPIYAWDDNRCGTSIETYTRGELETYSIPTLKLLLSYYQEMVKENINIHEVTDSFTVRLYGFESLKQAEEEAKKRSSK